MRLGQQQLVSCFRMHRWRIRTVMDSESCWEARGPVTTDGHPLVKFNDTTTTLRKIVFCFAHNKKWKISKRYILRDTCENPLCVRPSHVYSEALKSFHNEENRKGRKNLQPNRKISKEAAAEIRFSKDSAKILAKRHEISVAGVYAIKQRRYWK